jgi:hypothetical protein
MEWFYGSDFALAAGGCSGSVSTVIAGIAIAVRNAATQRDSNNGGEPTAVINVVRKDGSIIATGNGSTGGDRPA